MHKMIDNYVAAVYDQLAPIYDDHFKRPVDLAENTVITQFFRSLIPDPVNARVLELGCGTGFLLDVMPDIGHYMGQDISPLMLERAKTKHPYRDFYCGDMAELGQFDGMKFTHIVSTFGSFSYCTYPRVSANQQYYLLEQGGVVAHQVLGHRYRHRRSHIAGNVSYTTYSAHHLRSVFGGYRDVHVAGVNLLDFAPTLALEHNLLGLLFPDLFYYLIVVGTK